MARKPRDTKMLALGLAWVGAMLLVLGSFGAVAGASAKHPRGDAHRARLHARRTRAHARVHRHRARRHDRRVRLGNPGSVAGGSGGSSSGQLAFDGSFSTGLTPWTTGGGGAQCANYGTQSKSPRLRGTFAFDTSTVGVGTASGRFTLPADSNPGTFPLEACNLINAAQPIGLGTDDYYGLMVYVPQGWTIANQAFYGVEIMEYHFQNVYGAPVSFQLHPDHITLALQTGACSNHATVKPGCAFHSNADNPNGVPGNLPGYHVIPTGALVQGAWNEVLMHVHWASDNTGVIQTWYKVKGASTWTPSANVSGIPTVQWDMTTGCCYSNALDETEAYTAALSAPLTLWLDQQVTGTSFAAVATTMP